LLTAVGGPPRDAAILLEFDDVVVPHTAVGQVHAKDIANGGDALTFVGAGEVVVAVPARLLSRIGDQAEQRLRAGGNVPGDTYDAWLVGVGVHEHIEALRYRSAPRHTSGRACSTSRQGHPRCGTISLTTRSIWSRSSRSSTWR